MSRTYTPRSAENSTGMVFSDKEFDEDGEFLRVRQKISHAAARPFWERVRDDWNSRRPYYIIMIVVGLIIVTAIGLAIYVSGQ